VLEADQILFSFSAPTTAILFFGQKRLLHFWYYFIFRPKIGVFGRKWQRK